jgi:hypothetical protein
MLEVEEDEQKQIPRVSENVKIERDEEAEQNKDQDYIQQEYKTLRADPDEIETAKRKKLKRVLTIWSIN